MFQNGILTDDESVIERMVAGLNEAVVRVSDDLDLIGLIPCRRFIALVFEFQEFGVFGAFLVSGEEPIGCIIDAVFVDPPECIGSYPDSRHNRCSSLR